MKQTNLRKALGIFIVCFSLASFLFLNASVSQTTDRTLKSNTQTEAQINSEDEDVRELPVPAVNIISRLAELAHRVGGHFQ